MASEKAILHVVAVLCEAFGRKPTPTTYEVYGMALADVPDAALQTAAQRVVQTCKFMPTPSDLREMAGIATDADRAILAWSAVEQALPQGPFRHVDFDDWTINATIRSLGGWVTFLARFTDAEAEKWVRKEFIDAYRAFWRSGVGDESGAPLKGLAEVEVRCGRLCQPTPVRIETGLPVDTRPRIVGGSPTTSHPRLGGVSRISEAGSRS